MEPGTERYFEDVEVGSELPTITKEISIEQLAMYAAVCWDFRPEHYDSGTAQRYGFQAPYADGPMLTAFLGQVATNWMGLKGNCKKITATYRVMVFPGDVLICKGKVIDKCTKGDSNLVKCEVWAENQKEERVVYGTVTVALPSRSSGSIRL
jgi:acyl dehydratase